MKNDTVIANSMFNVLIAQFNAAIAKHESGEIKFNMGNQHNVYVFESAIENLQNPALFEKNIDRLKFVLQIAVNNLKWGYDQSDISVASHFSTFDVPELSSAWTD